MTPYFNSRAYTRRDQAERAAIRLTPYFNSRAYTRRDNACNLYVAADILFQFTRLYKARQTPQAKSRRLCLFQFTRLYKARRVKMFTTIKKVFISIHAPIQGATLEVTNTSQDGSNFNSRAYTRRDHTDSHTLHNKFVFQFTRLYKARLGF